MNNKSHTFFDRSDLGLINEYFVIYSFSGHDTFEAVSLTVCSLQSGCSTVELRALFNGSFIFVPDSTFYLTQFLISSVWDPDSLDNPARIKGENFNLCEEDFPNLDGRITCAFKHIERPPSWKIVTDSPRIDQNPPPRETLLHFAARFGLRDFAEHLLDHPASDVALKLPNKDGDLAVELARTSGLDSLADRMLDISKNVERQSLNEDCSQRSRRLEHVEGKACKIKRHYTLSTATITTKLDESNNAIEDDIQMLRDVVSYMEADDDDSPRMLSPRKLGKHTKFGQISPDQGLSESSCSEDEEDEDEDDYIRHREYRGTLEPVLEDSIQQLQSINHHVQHLRKENRVRLAEVRIFWLSFIIYYYISMIVLEESIFAFIYHIPRIML
ncbi:A-kinase anchor protein 13-like isoform X1 [Lytechinus pictus]|uniref:A-kinase anchor protein 13-like isoform X1 n=1 Tax=Lytechinus pictus TaxID=7653 RepID=UPI0030B9B687